MTLGVVISMFLGFSKKEFDTKSIFTSYEIVWYGLDFTKAHCIGNFDEGFEKDTRNTDYLQKVWIPSLNNLIATEQNNFNLKKAFKKQFVYYDLTSINHLNEKLDTQELLNYNETRITQSILKEMIKKYEGSKYKEGIGLAFIVENFNKNSNTGSLYVTFFDIATKKVLMQEYMTGKPAGLGLRNYWAGAVKDILMQIDFFEYYKWKNKYYYNTLYEEPQRASTLIDHF
jgi:hypothetical protein